MRKSFPSFLRPSMASVCGEAAHKLLARLWEITQLVHRLVGAALWAVKNHRLMLIFTHTTDRVSSQLYAAKNSRFFPVNFAFIPTIHTPYYKDNNSYKGDY